MPRPAFTKRHYVALAEWLRRTRPTNGDPGQHYQWIVAVNTLSCILNTDNDRYDREAFMRAVGL